jgi:hypothetical protein
MQRINASNPGSSKLRRLEALERDEESLWRRVDEMIAGKTVKTYDEAIGILKDLSDLALHKERREEFMRRVQTILGKYPRLSGGTAKPRSDADPARSSQCFGKNFTLGKS